MKITPYTPDAELSGFIAGMPNDAYHASPGISKSGLDLVARSPAHYQYREPRVPSPAMRMGTAIHTALLEPDRFAEDYLLLRDVADRRSSAYKEAAKTRDPEQILTGPEADRVAGMYESVYSQPHARAVLEAPGHRELSLFATDPETGVQVRCRFDLLTADGRAIDLKKTRDARPEAFSRSIYAYRYHVQAAFYMDLYHWATGDTIDEWRIIAVEKDLPHAAMVYKIDDLAIAEGRKIYREDLNRYAECLAANDWPAYPCDENEVIGLPEWVIRQMENDTDYDEFTFED